MVGESSEGIFKSKVSKFQHWNFSFNVAEASFYQFALIFISQITILPVFLSFFTNSKVLIGFLPSLYVFFWTFPQIISAYYTEDLGQKKYIIGSLRILHSLPWLFIAILTLTFLHQGEMRGILIFFLLYIIYSIFGGLSIPAQVSFIGKLIFPQRRGRFYGIKLFFGTGLGILGSLAVKYLLDNYNFPVNFSLCFLMGFALLNLSTALLLFSKEPSEPIAREQTSFKNYVATLKHILKRDKNLSWFILSMIFSAFGISMASMFLSLYLIEHFHAPISQIGIFSVILLSSQMAAQLIMGFAVDWKGAKLVFTVSRAFAVLTLVMALFAPSLAWGYLIFVFLGFFSGGAQASYHNLILELSHEKKRGIYVGLVNTIRAPFFALSPILGGYLIDHFSYHIAFMTAGVSALVCLIIISWRVRIKK